jgi:hypothetical protein
VQLTIAVQNLGHGGLKNGEGATAVSLLGVGRMRARCVRRLLLVPAGYAR